MLVDTHAHLNAPAFSKDCDQTIVRAQAAAVTQMVIVGYDLASSRRAVRLAQRYPGRLFAAVGIHPHKAAQADANAVTALRALATEPGVVAIGEIGLDYYRHLAPAKVQQRAFAAMLALAEEVALPAIIHSRDALPEALATLEAQGLPRGAVLHAFAGEPADALRAAQAGLMVSFAGPLTYPRATMLRAAAAAVPQTQMLIETDCPYLPPQPWRGKRNEPAYLPATLSALATAQDMTTDACAALVTANAQRFFALPAPDDRASA